MAIRIYTAKHCQPCHQVAQLIKEGRFSGEEEVELIDIETDEGFLKFQEEVLSFGGGAVPSAYKGGERCLLHVDDETNSVLIDCPTAPREAPEG